MAGEVSGQLTDRRSTPSDEDDGADSTSGGDSRSQSTRSNEAEEEPGQDDADPSRGVKEDLSELSQTLTGQFWASSLSSLPPPPRGISSHLDRRSDPTVADELNQDEAAATSGSRGSQDSEMISPRSGVDLGAGSRGFRIMRRMSIGRISSSFITFGAEAAEEEEEEEEEELSVIGVTEEVMAFARNIAMHPQTWLDSPLSTSLKTPTIAEARTMLLQLQNRSKPDYETSSRGHPYRNADITLVSPRGQVPSSSKVLS